MCTIVLLVRRATMAVLITVLAASAANAQTPWLRDRGPGLATSMFATGIERRQLIIYPFFEYYRNNDEEYSPEELGYGLDEDYRGRFRASEGLIFLGYGITDWLAVELEAAVITAQLETAPEDPTAIPDRIEESGVGDVEGQIRLRWGAETERRPELFSYLEIVAPVQKKKLLIGTSDWEFKLGTGVTKGLSWGTVTGRLAVEYSAAESKAELGEIALEYIRRLSNAWRGYIGVEGTQDEVELITEAQLFITDRVVLKLNNAFGVTSKATDWAPEVGVLFRLGAN